MALVGNIKQITLPNGDTYNIVDKGSRDSITDLQIALDGKINKVTSATSGNFAEFNTNGEVIDSGLSSQQIYSKIVTATYEEIN